MSGSHLAGAGDNRRRQGVGEQVGPGALPEEVRQLARPGGVPARRAAQRLPQRRVDDVHRPGHAEMLLSAPAGRQEFGSDGHDQTRHRGPRGRW